LAASTTTRLGCTPKAGGVKGLSPETLATPGGGQFPDAIVAILSANIHITDTIPNGLTLRKADLTPQQAYGLGLPNGHSVPPPNNPTGPWVGLMYPYRDFNDGYVPSTGMGFPPGNSVGVIDLTGAALGRYAVTEMVGRMDYRVSDPASYQRGIPGNGASDFAAFFQLDLVPLSGIERDIIVTLDGVSVRALVHDINGVQSEVTLDAPTLQTTIHIPAPSTAAPLAALGLLIARRRR
jgi:hypothetical protein